MYFDAVWRGNHFAAWQESQLSTNEPRAARRSLR